MVKDAILILKEQKKQGWCLIKPPIRTDRITPINQGNKPLRNFMQQNDLQVSIDFQIQKSYVWLF